MYFVDVDCYCLRGCVLYGRPHNSLANCQWKILAEAKDLLCYLGLLEWVYQVENGVHHDDLASQGKLDPDSPDHHELSPESIQLFLRGHLTNINPLYGQ